MNKIYIFFLFLLVTFFSTMNPVYAFEINTDNSFEFFGYIACGLLMVLGVVIIIITKFSKAGGTGKAFFEEKEKEKVLPGLTEKETKEEEKKEIETTFDPDSIFKILPTFAKNKFLNDTFEELKDKVNNKDLKVSDKIIEDFKDEDNRYIIITKYECKIDNESDSNKKETYRVTSINNKNNDTYTCPNCGGKIKDVTMLRCKYCNAILPNMQNGSNTNNWQIDKFEKIN